MLPHFLPYERTPYPKPDLFFYITLILFGGSWWQPYFYIITSNALFNQHLKIAFQLILWFHFFVFTAPYQQIRMIVYTQRVDLASKNGTYFWLLLQKKYSALFEPKWQKHAILEIGFFYDHDAEKFNKEGLRILLFLCIIIFLLV